MSTPRGKIGRLPATLRNEVNAMLRDNKSAAQIQAFLRKEKVKGISPQNISAWKSHGYQAWLRRQERIDGMRARIEFAKTMAADVAPDGGGLVLESEAASHLAVDSILEVLEGFDPTLLKDLLAEKPEKFVALVESLAALRKGDHSFVTLKMKFDEYRRRVRDQLKTLHEKTKTGGSATAKDIDQVMKEIYGT